MAEALRPFPEGMYLSDLHIGAVQDLPIRAFRLLLSAFVRGNVHLHFQTAAQAVEELRRAGFDRAEVRRAAQILADGGEWSGGGQLVHIIEASTVRPSQ